MNTPVILVVSRDPSVVAFFKRGFKTTCHVLDTENPASALEYMQHTAIDLMIFDEKIVDLNFFKRIRQIATYESVPLLLITGNLKNDFTNDALNAGVSDFLPFPLDLQLVHQRLAVTIKAHEIRKKMATLPRQIKSGSSPGASLKTRFLLSDATLKELIKAKESKTPSNILMIEVDNYSEIFEKWGETTCAEVMLTLTSFLSAKLREHDLLFPQGNGKFVLLLPKTSQRAGSAIAETLRKEVCSTSFVANKTPLYLTVSMGVVSFNEKPGVDDFDRLLENVSRALAEAKRQGNRVVAQFG